MQEGYAPLHAAAAKGHDDMVRVLLEAGANLDLQNKVWKSFIGSLSLPAALIVCSIVRVCTGRKDCTQCCKGIRKTRCSVCFETSPGTGSLCTLALLRDHIGVAATSGHAAPRSSKNMRRSRSKGDHQASAF